MKEIILVRGLGPLEPGSEEEVRAGKAWKPCSGGGSLQRVPRNRRHREPARDTARSGLKRTFVGCGVRACLGRARLEAGRLWRGPLPPVGSEATSARTGSVRSGKPQPSNPGRGAWMSTGWWEELGTEPIVSLEHRSARGGVPDPRGGCGVPAAASEVPGTAWLGGTACSLHMACLPRGAFRGGDPGRAQPVTRPLCSAFPGGRGGRSLGRSGGPRGGWPGSHGCSLVCHLPWPREQVGRVVEWVRAVATGAGQSYVSPQAVCPWGSDLASLGLGFCSDDINIYHLAFARSGLRGPTGEGGPGMLHARRLPPGSGFFPTRSTVSAKQQQWQRWPFRAPPGWCWPVGPSAGLDPRRTAPPPRLFPSPLLLIVLRSTLWRVPWEPALGAVLPWCGYHPQQRRRPRELAGHRLSDPLRTFCPSRLPRRFLCSVKFETQCSGKRTAHRNRKPTPPAESCRR